MKNLRIILVIALFATFSFAQKTKKDNWIRVQSDDGEFSVELPKKYNHFYDKEGFSFVSWGNGTYLREMSIINAYNKDTLLNVERYKVEESSQNKSRESLEKTNPFKSVTEEISRKLAMEDPRYLTIQKTNKSWIDIDKYDFKISQLTRKSEEEFTIKQHFYSESFVYILTASSRKGLTPEITRFLNSLEFNPKRSNQIKENVEIFSKLKQTKIEFSEKPESELPITKTKIDKSLKPLLLIANPSVPYTAEAVKNGTVGTIILEATFSETGQITKIIVRKSLDYGLVHNAFLTMLRMKFLPALKKGKPVSTVKIFDYEFRGFL
jgi:Gram-negative bacterial TonB protein C-terminal